MFLTVGWRKKKLKKKTANPTLSAKNHNNKNKVSFSFFLVNKRRAHLHTQKHDSSLFAFVTTTQTATLD